jgi:tRNA modification GTPase
LSRKQKSIVTPHPGTTRDLIEEYVQFSGAPMVLADTAGLHETDNAIETMGIDIAKQQIERADLILFVVEAGRPFTENERSIYRLFKEKPVILISNKTDLVSRSPAHSEPTDLSFYAIVSTSATQNTGIDRLQQAIETIVKDRLSVFTDPIVPNVRQTSLLESALESLSQFLDNLERQVPLDLLVLDLQETIGCLDAIIGNTVPTDVLDRIFGDFCIGK